MQRRYPSKELFSTGIYGYKNYLTVDRTSKTLEAGLSLSVIIMGNLPIFTKTLPNNLGIFFINVSEATKQSNGLAHFLMSFLSLLNFLRPSSSMHGIPSF